MERYEFWGFQVELDKERTQAYYTDSKEWGCDCSYCRNFLEIVKKEMLPTEVTGVLEEMSIPPEKATYVCEIYPKEDKYCYQFSYRIAGNILGENAELSKSQEWGEGRCCHEPYPHGAPGFPTPHFDLEFWVELPWVIEESAK